MRDLHRTGQGVIKPAVDASGTVDFGSVDSLTRDDTNYQLLGDWGEINLQSDNTPSLSIDPTPFTWSNPTVRDALAAGWTSTETRVRAKAGGRPV